MKTKTFDCIDMKRRGAEQVHERLKDMTVQQRMAYWREQTEQLRQRQAAVRAARPDTAS